MKKYHYFYKITNTINGHFYYGVHNTDNLDDGYMGSGKRLLVAYEKYGIANFRKEVICFFDTADEAFKYESEYVTESLTKNDDCYNIQKGGRTFNTSGMLPVVDKEGNCFLVNKDDERYKNGEFVFNWCGKHHTEKTKNKIRETMTPKNSKNDRVWVNKEGIVKYLRKDLLLQYIKEGWTLGRVGYNPRKNGQGKIIK